MEAEVEDRKGGKSENWKTGGKTRETGETWKTGRRKVENWKFEKRETGEDVEVEMTGGAGRIEQRERRELGVPCKIRATPGGVQGQSRK